MFLFFSGWKCHLVIGSFSKIPGGTFRVKRATLAGEARSPVVAAEGLVSAHVARSLLDNNNNNDNNNNINHNNHNNNNNSNNNREVITLFFTVIMIP